MKLNPVRRCAALPLKEIEKADATNFDRDCRGLELAGCREFRVEDASCGGDVWSEDARG